ncbi:YjbH domain-containing protein [Roseivivax sp. CAU 1761]
MRFDPATGRRHLRRAALLGLTALTGTAAAQQSVEFPSYNLYGAPGLIDTPTAEMAPDGTLALTFGNLGPVDRGTLTFQLLPRLSGSFRYARLRDSTLDNRDDYYDRSFDLRFQLLTEGAYRPAVAVGLQDFIGTGLNSGEYVVATKEVVPGVKLTGGLGWGRLASHSPIGSLGSRDPLVVGRGGTVDYSRFFQGDVGVFGGLSWAVSDKLRLAVEYSSDSYDLEERNSDFDHRAPFNFGLDYRLREDVQLSLYHAYGNEVGFQVSLLNHLKSAPVPGGNEAAPLPVRPRGARAVDLGWSNNSIARNQVRGDLGRMLDEQGIGLEGLALEPRRAVVRIDNRRYNVPAQAIGRTARAMSRVLPAAVEEFVIMPSEGGVPASAIVVQRSDLETLEFDAAEAILARAAIVDAAGLVPPTAPEAFPDFEWWLGPTARYSTFDPDDPLRIDYGITASGTLRLTPGLELAGAVTRRLGGNIAEADTDTASPGVPAVRTSYAKYAREGDTAIDYLTLAHYGRPAEALYSRLTFGYLERMYAGASGELLWKPVDSRLALGAELNAIQRRDFDMGFGLQDMQTISGEIPNLNGHATAYYDFGGGFRGQLSAGRYLAGDWGTTVSLDREFGNGWSVGAFATFTELSADEFGEGSFDKGIRVTLPLNWALGTANRRKSDVTIRPITRDGGAQLYVRGRLYDRVRGDHRPELAETWGRFWR